MAVRSNDDPADEPSDAETPADERRSSGPDQSRYAGLCLADGEVIVYDRENENAWVQSDTAVESEAVA